VTVTVSRKTQLFGASLTYLTLVWSSECSMLYCRNYPALKLAPWSLIHSKSQSQSYITPAGHSASLSWCQAPMWGPRKDFYYCQTVAGLLMWGALSDEKMGLSFTIAAGPRQHRHSRVRVPQDSWEYFTVSDSRLPQPKGPGPRIYIRREQGGPVIPPGTGFTPPRLLQLPRLRWRYANPPARGGLIHCCCVAL
jgi:hypothetical protein